MPGVPRAVARRLHPLEPSSDTSVVPWLVVSGRDGGLIGSAPFCDSSVRDAGSSELPGSRQSSPVLRHAQAVVPVALGLIVDVTLAITRLQKSGVDGDDVLG